MVTLVLPSWANELLRTEETNSNVNFMEIRFLLEVLYHILMGENELEKTVTRF